MKASFLHGLCKSCAIVWGSGRNLSRLYKLTCGCGSCGCKSLELFEGVPRFRSRSSQGLIPTIPPGIVATVFSSNSSVLPHTAINLISSPKSTSQTLHPEPCTLKLFVWGSFPLPTNILRLIVTCMIDSRSGRAY